MHTTRQLRDFLKDDIRQRTDFTATDQALELPMPPISLPVPEGAKLISLPEWRGQVRPQGSLEELITARRSRRGFQEQGLSTQQLSFLLWATQGIRKDVPGRVVRNVPSAGNRHPAETFLSLLKPAPDSRTGEAIAPGLYRYLPREHALLFLGAPDNLPEKTQQAALNQAFAAKAAVVFFWAVIPYRTEWRYAQASHKVIALDLGHICQNLYLACEATGLGACAIAAYDQKAADALLSLDGQDAFVSYMAAVGRQ